MVLVSYLREIRDFVVVECAPLAATLERQQPSSLYIFAHIPYTIATIKPLRESGFHGVLPGEFGRNSGKITMQSSIICE